MKDFLVSWEMYVTAETPEAAAQEAAKHQQTLRTFEIFEESGDSTTINLEEAA